jgi:hypothetical protein
MKKNAVKFRTNFKLASAILFVALIGVAALNAGAFAVAQARPTRIAESKTSAEAKRILAGMGSPDFKRIKDARMRDALSRAVAALKAVANNTSAAREAELVANFGRTIKALQAFPQSTNADTRQCDDSYERCMELCKETGANCDICKLSNEGCYLTKLAAEATKNPNDPTP